MTAGGSPETASISGGASNGGSSVVSTTTGGVTTSSASTWSGGAASAGVAGMTATGSGGCGLLIDDMESQTGWICEGSGRRGAWYAYNDQKETGTQWPSRTVTPGTPIEVSSCDRTPNGHCMHTYGSGFSTWGAGIGFDLNFEHKPYASYDASAYDGISFWAKGTSFDFRISTVDTTLMKYGGSCELEECKYEPPKLGINVTAEWQQYRVPFNEMRGYRGIFPRDKITNVQFDHHHGAAFDFWVDDVAFYVNRDCCAGPLPQCEVLEFADKNLMEAARLSAARATGNVLCTDLCNTLGISIDSVTSLSGIECLAHLQGLSLSSARDIDLEPITSLVNLTSLDLAGNSLSRIEPLRKLPKLSRLTLSNNKLTDLSALSGLTELTSLNLSNNPITDIAPLAGLVNLTSLELEGCAVASLAPLAQLSRLTSLDVTVGEVESLEVPRTLKALTSLTIRGGRVGRLFVGNLESLRSLNLSNASVDRLVIEALPSAEYITVDGGAVGDLSVASDMAHLTSVSVARAGLKSATLGAGTEGVQSLILPMNQLRELQLPSAAQLLRLDISRNQVLSLETLPKLPNLEYLNASSNQLSALTVLDGLSSLVLLDLSENQIHTISLPPDMSKLTNLDLANNALVDLVGLPQHTSLTDLDISSNQVVDLKPLARFALLEDLMASENAISDISALATLAKLRYVKLDKNRIAEIAPLAKAGLPIDFGTLWVSDNPLKCATEAQFLAELKARHVSVLSDCK